MTSGLRSCGSPAYLVSEFFQPWRSRAKYLAMTSLLLLSGCTRLKVKMGWKVEIAQIQVTSIQASLAKGPGIAPGQKLPLVVTLAGPNGKNLLSEGAGHGKVLWKDLKVTGSVVTVNQKGIVLLSRDPRVSDGQVGHVTVTVPSHPDLRAELDIPVRYDQQFMANFSGSSGSSGFDGTSGLDGMSGSSGSLDPNNPSAGGDGSDGGNGGDGSSGGSGGNAPAVSVLVTLRPGAHPLLQISVAAAGQQKLYLVDPQGGALAVLANGGEGGSGGKGGRGGRGGSGGVGSPSGHSGRDGSSGHDGSSGFHGQGGPITVVYDPQVKPFLGNIHLSSRYGPAPVFREETVAPLW